MSDTEQRSRAMDEYLNTVRRLEPDITMIDNGAAAASISISLKRIADFLDWAKKEIESEKEKNK